MSIWNRLFQRKRNTSETEHWFFREGGREQFERKIRLYRNKGVDELLISNFDFCPKRVEYRELRPLLQEQFGTPAVYLNYTDTPGQEDILLLIGGACHE